MLVPHLVLKGAILKCRNSCVPALAKTVLGPGDIAWNKPLLSTSIQKGNGKTHKKMHVTVSAVWHAMAKNKGNEEGSQGRPG